MSASYDEIEDFVDLGKAGPIKVSLRWVGEGSDGEWDPSDPEDAPLYRVDVEVETFDASGWKEEDQSVLTEIVAGEEDVAHYKMIAQKAADLILYDMEECEGTDWTPGPVLEVIAQWDIFDQAEDY